MIKIGRRVKNLSRADLNQIIPLHQDSLADIGAILGTNYLSRFYNLLFSETDHTLLGVFEKDKLIGLLAGSFNLPETHLSLRQLLKIREILLVLVNIFIGKIDPGRIIQRLQLEKFLFQKMEDNSGGIVILLVKEDYRRQGIGRLLIEEFLRRCRKKKIDEVYVDTLESFQGTLTFYRSLGFSIRTSSGQTHLLSKKIVEFT